MLTPNASSANPTPKSDILRYTLKISAILIASTAVVWSSQNLVKGRAAEQTHAALAAAGTCSVDEPVFDVVTDGRALANYKRWVSQLLKGERFDDLECIAQAARKDKTRFSGDEWKLHKFYVGLQEPNPDMHATDADWENHLTAVNHWLAAKPDSVTARIVLAASYVEYAWFARGNGASDSVSDNGWQQFESRMRFAEKTLNEDPSLQGKDPEWFLVMLNVATGEGWQPPRAMDLFQKAVAFEPGFFYYHRVMANFLLPKWHGEEGDASSLIKASADKIGGSEGDGLYFLAASGIVCPCEEPELTRLSWTRLQSGFTYVEKQYGVSMRNLNYYAVMASKFRDASVGYDAFNKIGENWDGDIWRNEQYFRQTKQWVDAIGQMEEANRTAMKQAESNAQTPAGAQYRKVVEQKFAGFVSSCADKAKEVQDKVDLAIQVGDKGDVKGLSIKPTAPGQFVGCLMTQLMTPQTGNPMPLPVPPNAPYWVKVEVDPTVVQAAAH